MFFCDDREKAMDHARSSSLTTHPGPIAAEACAFLSYLLVTALHRTDATDARTFLTAIADAYISEHLTEGLRPGADVVKRLLLAAEPEDSEESCWNWREEQALDLAKVMRARGSE